MLRLVREMNEKRRICLIIKYELIAGNYDPRSTLMFTMLNAFARFERALIKEGREEIALAKAKGNV